MNDCLSMRDRYFAPGTDGSTDPTWLSHLDSCAACRQAHRALPAVDRALAQLPSLAVAVPSFDAIAADASEAARRQRRRRALRRSAPFFYTALGTAALAACVAAVFLVGGGRQARPRLLAPGAELQATGEGRSARLANGARIRLEAGALKLAAEDPAHPTLVLATGRVAVEVPKLPTGATLSVRTPDAEVRVHGTRFQVARANRETQVTVTEGVVEVRPEGGGRATQTLTAGQSLTVPSPDLYRDGLREASLAALDHGELDTAENRIDQLLQTNPEPGQRAEAQALLAWSLSARGKRGEAIAHYHQALSLLPQGQKPLWAENACAELAILIGQASPRDSAAAWAECLQRFPDGVHAGVARSRLHSGR